MNEIFIGTVGISDLVYDRVSGDRQILKVKLGEVQGYA